MFMMIRQVFVCVRIYSVFLKKSAEKIEVF